MLHKDLFYTFLPKQICINEDNYTLYNASSYKVMNLRYRIIMLIIYLVVTAVMKNFVYRNFVKNGLSKVFLQLSILNYLNYYYYYNYYYQNGKCSSYIIIHFSLPRHNASHLQQVSPVESEKVGSHTL